MTCVTGWKRCRARSESRAASERFEQRETIPASQRFDPIPDTVPWEGVLALFRVAQEALRNIARSLTTP